MLSEIAFLIVFPAIAAVGIYLCPQDALRHWLVKIASAVIGVVSVVCAFGVIKGGGLYFPAHTIWADKLIFVLEGLLSLYLIIQGIKHKRPLVVGLVLFQILTMIFLEFFSGHHIEAQNNLFIDQFSAIMALIIGIIGTLICIFAIGYMKDFQHHHQTSQTVDHSFSCYYSYFCPLCLAWYLPIT